MPIHSHIWKKAREQHLIEKRCQIIKARIMRDVLNINEAAAYLRDRGWSVEAAVHILVRS